MTITIHIHDSLASIPVALSRILLAAAALEKPRQPGDDGEDLAELLDGIDAPEPAPAAPAPARPAPQPSPATPLAPRRFDGEPVSGQSLYKWACQAKCLPRVNALGKARGWHKLVTHWDASQVAEAYATLTAEPAANGQANGQDVPDRAGTRSRQPRTCKTCGCRINYGVYCGKCEYSR
jgi:hypothetical protein